MFTVLGDVKYRADKSMFFKLILLLMKSAVDLTKHMISDK
jgi:hypothetical protein